MAQPPSHHAADVAPDDATGGHPDDGGYFQLFAEPYVMTQGGPLQSTVSVLYLMYRDAFKWWDLGVASAEAFILFLLMFAVTAAFLRLTRRGGQA